MCYLSDTDLIPLVAAGKLVVPCRQEQIQPYSIDLHLGNRIYFGRYHHPARGYNYVGLPHHADQQEWQIHTFGADRTMFILSPGEFVLAATEETVIMPPEYLGRVEGVSSNARIGLAVEQAGVIEGGFQGQITLELFNMSHQNLILTHNCRIAHLLVATGLSTPTHPYGHPARRSRYQGQRGPTTARALPPVPGERDAI